MHMKLSFVVILPLEGLKFGFFLYTDPIREDTFF